MPSRAEPPSRRPLRQRLHRYLAYVGLSLSPVVYALNLWAYYDEGQQLTHLAFGADVLELAVLMAGWFWGIYLLLEGLIPRHRIRTLLVHAALGSVAPLLYTVAIGIQMGTLNSQPVGDPELGIEFGAIVVLLAQLPSGRAMAHRRSLSDLFRRSRLPL